MLLLFAAGGLAIVAWGRQVWPPAFSTAGGCPDAAARKRRRLCLAGIAAAALVDALAVSRYLSRPNQTFGAAGWLWLAGMGALVASTAGWPRAGARAGHTPTSGHVSEPASWTGWELALLGAIFGLALLLRVWDLTSFPFAIHPDEIITGRVATGSYLAGPQSSIFSTVWSGINLPALWFRLVAWSLELGGSTLAAVRLPAALFGAATIIPFYALVRGIWGRAAAIAGGTILAFSASNVHYSRITLNNIVAPFFWALCFCFLLRALRRGRPADWAAAGLAAGLSEYSYYGTRLLPFVLLAFLAYLLLVHWRTARHHLGGYTLLTTGYVIGFGPLMAYFVTHRGLYLGRGAGVLTWSRAPQSWHDLQQMWKTLWPIMAQNLLAIGTVSSDDSLYFAPLLRPAEAALLALGVALLIARWRQPAAFLLLLAGGGVLFVGGTLVPSPRFIAHWTPAFPAFYAALAAPVGAGAAACRGLPARLRWAGLAGLSLALAALGWLNVDFYFRHYYAARPEFEIRAAQSRYQAALGAAYRVRNVGRTWQPYDPETNAYLVKGQDGAQIYNPAAELPLPGVGDKGLAFFFFPDNEQYEGVVHTLYPGGSPGEVKSAGGTHYFRTYTLTAARAAAEYGASLQVFAVDSSKPSWSGRVPAVGDVPPVVNYPLRARWSGALYIPRPGPYRLDVAGVDATALMDGQSLHLPIAQTLAGGWHPFVVEAVLTAAGSPSLTLAAGDAAPDPVPPSHLWPLPAGQGLLASFASAAAPGSAGLSPSTRVDPFVGFTGDGRPDLVAPGQNARSSWRVRWAGEVQLDRTGTYSLEVHTTGQARLFVDGQAVLAVCSTGEPVQAGASIPAPGGWHTLQLDYISRPDSFVVELYWMPPGAARAIVPPDALRYARAPDVLASRPQPPDAVDCTPP